MKITIHLYDNIYSVETPNNDLTLSEAMEELVKPVLSAVYSSSLIEEYFGEDELGLEEEE